MNISKLSKSILCALSVLLLWSAPAQQAQQARYTVSMGFRDGATTKDCGGSKGVCFIISRDKTSAAKARGGVQGVASMEGDKLRIDFESTLPGQGKRETIAVFEDMALDAGLANKLGYKSVTMLRGDYRVDYSRQKNGAVLVDVRLER